MEWTNDSITALTDDAPVLLSGEGYANLTDDSSFSGRIALTPNWATVQTENGRYTIPRRRIDFINWKAVDEQ